MLQDYCQRKFVCGLHRGARCFSMGTLSADGHVIFAYLTCPSKDDMPLARLRARNREIGLPNGARGYPATKNPGTSTDSGVSGGGWGIRTPEGLHPTRFPSVRHRPLGESSRCSTTINDRVQREPSISDRTASLPPASARIPVRSVTCCSRRWTDCRQRAAVGYTRTRPLVWRHPVNPPGPEGSKGKRALTGARGVLTFFASAAMKFQAYKSPYFEQKSPPQQSRSWTPRVKTLLRVSGAL